MRLSEQTRREVQSELSRLRLIAANYSRFAIAARWRTRREWFEEQVARYDALVASLNAVLEMEGTR
jgi:hypothetical protein